MSKSNTAHNSVLTEYVFTAFAFVGQYNWILVHLSEGLQPKAIGAIFHARWHKDWESMTEGGGGGW